MRRPWAIAARFIVSDTWGPFGALIGVAGVHNRVFTTGWEDGNSGWTNPALTAAQCSQATCNTTGGGNFSDSRDRAGQRHDRRPGAGHTHHRRAIWGSSIPVSAISRSTAR